MSDAEGDKHREAGMIGKRVLLPLGMWTEILGMAKGAGCDHRDLVLQLIDLGMQAQDTGRFRPRFLSIDPVVVEKIGAAAAGWNLTEDELLTRILDLGLQAKAEDMRAAAASAQRDYPEDPPEGVECRFYAQGERLGVLHFPSPPAPGELIRYEGRDYVVESRGWTVGGGKAVAHLRLEEA